MINLSYIFLLFSILIVLSAFYVLYTKSVAHGAFMLLITFLGVASIFVFGGSDFLAVAQIMIYVGGILVLLVFGVLLTNKKNKEREEHLGLETNNYNRILGGFVAFSIFSVLIFIFSKVPFSRLEGQHFDIYEPPKSTIQNLGIRLILENSLPLEAVGILLMGALIGAGFIAKTTIKKLKK